MDRPKSPRKKIKRWRKKHGLSIEALALRLGYGGHAAFARWESAHRSLPIPRILLLARLSGFGVRELADPHQLALLERMGL